MVTENRKKLRNKIRKIKRAFDKAEQEFNSLPRQIQDEINQMHNADGSLDHCIRFGQQAAEELQRPDMFKDLVHNIDINYRNIDI